MAPLFAIVMLQECNRAADCYIQTHRPGGQGRRSVPQLTRCSMSTSRCPTTCPASSFPGLFDCPFVLGTSRNRPARRRPSSSLDSPPSLARPDPKWLMTGVTGVWCHEYDCSHRRCALRRRCADRGCHRIEPASSLHVTAQPRHPASPM